MLYHMPSKARARLAEEPLHRNCECTGPRSCRSACSSFVRSLRGARSLVVRSLRGARSLFVRSLRAAARAWRRSRCILKLASSAEAPPVGSRICSSSYAAATCVGARARGGGLGLGLDRCARARSRGGEKPEQQGWGGVGLG